MKLTFVLVILILFGQVGISQIDFKSSVFITPSFSNIKTKGVGSDSQNQFFLNYGMSISGSKERHGAILGFEYNQQGYKLTYEVTSTQSPESGTGAVSDVFRIKSLNVPILYQYSFVRKDKIEVSVITGIIIGKVLSQSFDMQISSFQTGLPIYVYDPSVDPDSDMNSKAFSDFLMQTKVGIMLNRQLSEKLNLTTSPFLLIK